MHKLILIKFHSKILFRFLTNQNEWEVLTNFMGFFGLLATSSGSMDFDRPFGPLSWKSSSNSISSWGSQVSNSSPWSSLAVGYNIWRQSRVQDCEDSKCYLTNHFLLLMLYLRQSSGLLTSKVLFRNHFLQLLLCLEL